MAEKTFEETMEKLENIVEELERGDLTLEETLKKYEEGMRYSKFCMDRLSQAEQKLKKLVKTENGFQLDIL
ncbi:exodeoxyribonuclease VII small subunit [candidate division KSB1 bacterium]|nr:exodeoxyribonuclease VII small subunit [candidate division KSB1 bacterium]